MASPFKFLPYVNKSCSLPFSYFPFADVVSAPTPTLSFLASYYSGTEDDLKALVTGTGPASTVHSTTEYQPEHPSLGGTYRPFETDEEVFKFSRYARNIALDSETPATQTFSVLNGETYIFSAFDVFNYTFSGVGVSETLIGATIGERKAITLVPTSGGLLTLTVVSEG